MSASKIVRSHKDRYCDECRSPHIRKGDLYERWTHFPGDDTYSWVSRDTGKPLGQPVTMSFCRDGALRYDRPSLAEFERREIADGRTIRGARGRQRIHGAETEESREQSKMNSEPKTPSENELARTYVEHLGPITLGTEFARQQEARRGIAKVKADALREWSGLVRSELAASTSHGIDLGENFLHGAHSMLRQAGEYADRIEGAINE